MSTTITTLKTLGVGLLGAALCGVAQYIQASGGANLNWHSVETAALTGAAIAAAAYLKQSPLVPAPPALPPAK